MITSQDTLRPLADRIERAYRRRHPGWRDDGQTPGVWLSAAARLLAISGRGWEIPIDPELFVAVQKPGGPAPDPWAELTRAQSVDRYLKALRRIILLLRKELRAEVRRAERGLRLGLTLDEVLTMEEEGISPLARYIMAYRAGRDDLSMRHRAAAEDQHRSCPLYRMASRSFLPDHAYPSTAGHPGPSTRPKLLLSFSLN